MSLDRAQHQILEKKRREPNNGSDDCIHMHMSNERHLHVPGRSCYCLSWVM